MEWKVGEGEEGGSEKDRDSRGGGSCGLSKRIVGEGGGVLCGIVVLYVPS